ncbi:mucin-binding protein, partial [Lactobacillus amylovorus]|uniref:mucin-binding protein n=1 Tax=Lactobacillus amylovorus TaxID=1604 RepID=UPI003B983E0F
MGASSPVVHAATTSSESAASSTDINKPVGVAENSTMNDADPVDVAGYSTMNDADVNNAIDKYAQGKQKELQKELGDHAPLIRASDKQPVTVDTLGKRAYQVGKIKDKIDTDIEQAKEQAKEDNESIEKYKKDHPQTLNGEDSDFFKNQGLSIDDEKDSKINQISVDHKDISLKDITLPKDKDQSEKFDGIDGIDVTYTNKMTHKEQQVMKINSDNKVIVDFQHNQCSGKEITVTYDNLNNSYYLENINNKTNRIKISKIERTFSDIHPTDNTIFTSNGSTPTSDGLYDECHGPQLIIYNDPSDGFFYNNIKQVSVKDIYYGDDNKPITFKAGDKNEAWIFVTSLNSDGVSKNNHTYREKVKAEIKVKNSDGTSADIPADIEKLAGSTVTGPVEGNAADTHHGWWYSDEDNGSYNNGPYTGLAWDNNSEDNRYAFVGAVAIKYQPGLTITYGADDNAWGSHWVCTQTQVVSSLNQRVIIYDHIKDGTENVTGNDDVNMTVHYVMDDGSNAPSDSKQTVNFTETGVKDKVTGKIAWTPADSQTLNDVESPVLTGYTADIKTAKGKAVNFGDPDINVTVHYSANAQTAKITYIDDTTKNNLYSQAANGKFGQAITFTTDPTKDIANYEKQGYKLVSNDFKDGTKYKADDKQNEFIVHLTHDKPGKGDETKPGKGDETKPG